SDLLPYTGNDRKRAGVVSDYRAPEGVGSKAREERERHLGSDPRHLREHVQHGLLLRGGEPVEKHLVVSNHEPCEESRGSAGRRQVRSYRRRNQDLVANALY